MKKNLKRMGVVAALAMMLVLAMATSVSFAAIPDTAGNAFGVEESGNINCEKDYYWAGSTLQAENVKIGYDAIVAGQTIDLTLGTIGGSFRAAAQNIILSDIEIGHNITAAGEKIVINNGTTMEGAYLAGSEIQFNGTANALTVGAGDVVIDGTVNGDVVVSAGTITFGPNAVVTGTVRGTVGAKPEVSSGASVPNVKVTIKKDAKDYKASLLGFSIFAKLAGIVGAIVIGLFMCIVFKNPLASAARAIKQKPVAIIVTGIVAIIAVPIACVLLMITVIGIPVALLVLALYILTLTTAVAFAGTSLGQVVFPKWNRWGSSMLGVAILAVVCAIPWVGGVFRLAAMIFALGYFLQIAYHQMTSK